MVVRYVKLHFAQFIGQVVIIAPFFVGGLEGAAVHPDPALGAGPLNAAADIREAAGNRHGDMAGILQLDPVFGGGVPDRAPGRELAPPLQLVRSGVVEAAPPMGDVAMAPNPIHHLAAPGIVVPAPVPMNATLNVRCHVRRANPEVVVQLRRRVARRHASCDIARVMIPPGEADIHVVNVAEPQQSG